MGSTPSRSTTNPATQPRLASPTPGERARLTLVYHFCRLQYPALAVSEGAFRKHLQNAAEIYASKLDSPLTWTAFLDGLYALDWTVCTGCLEGLNRAWETLFSVRTGRSDCLLIDALRARAARLYPRDEEKQETAVAEFWSHLIVSDTQAPPVLFRYDGQRPLAPWLIRVFQNLHLTRLRQTGGIASLPDDDIAMPLPTLTRSETRWHEAFTTAARHWLNQLPDNERLLLGMRWRYKLSQRDIAQALGVHEGTISRQTDKLRDSALEIIGKKLLQEGWTGDDIQGFILTEMAGILTDDPRLSADALRRLLTTRGVASFAQWETEHA